MTAPLFDVDVDMVLFGLDPFKYLRISNGWNLADPEERPLSMMNAIDGSFTSDLTSAVL